jgi:phosphate transport system protein
VVAEPEPADEVRLGFHETLDEIRRGLVTMASLVAENVSLAGEAMRDRRLELIEVVRNADLEVNRMYAELEALSFETLARQQPVARDLRFLVATTRILYELERSGDLAVNCVNMLDREHGFPGVPRLMSTLDRLVEAAVRVFRMAIDVVADMDETGGPRLDEADDEVDDIVSTYYTEIGAAAENIGLETAIAMSRVGRFLERIADHAVNIAENVTYIVTAQFPDDTHAALRDEGGD